MTERGEGLDRATRRGQRLTRKTDCEGELARVTRVRAKAIRSDADHGTSGLDHAEDEDRGVVRPGQARRDAGCRFREPGQIRRQKNAQVH